MSIIKSIRDKISSFRKSEPKIEIQPSLDGWSNNTYFHNNTDREVFTEDLKTPNSLNLAFESSKAYKDIKVAFQIAGARVVSQVPPFQTFKNIYYAIPEVQSVVTKLVDRFVSTGWDLTDEDGNQNNNLETYLENKYNITHIAKQLASQKLVYGNALIFADAYQKPNIFVLDSFIIPPLNECSIFTARRTKIDSFYWINPQFGSIYVQDDFAFYKEQSAGNAFFGDSPLTSLELSSGIINKDAKNYNEYFDNGSFAGLLFLFDDIVPDAQRQMIKATLDQWKNSNSRYRAGVMGNMKGAKIEQRKPEIGVLDVAQREYIWKTIINSYHVPSDFVLRQGGLGAGEQKTMLENLKNDAILPLVNFVEPILNNFVLKEIFKHDGEASRLNKDKKFYKIKFNEINTETQLEKSQRLLAEVKDAQLPIKDYFLQMYPQMANKELYKHWDTYTLPSNIIVQPIGQTVETTLNDGKVTEEQTKVTEDKADLKNQNIIEAKTEELEPIETIDNTEILNQSKKANLVNPVAFKIDLNKLVQEQPLYITDLQKKKITGQTRSRVKFFSSKAMDGDLEVSPIPALKNKQEFKQIQTVIENKLFDQYKSAILPILKKKQVETKKAELTEADLNEIEQDVEKNTNKLDLSDVLTLLYVVSMFGRENALKYVKEGNQPELTQNERELIDKQVKSYIANRIGSETGKISKLELEINLKKQLQDELKQFDYTDFNLNQTSRNEIASIIKTALEKDLTETQVLDLIKKKVTFRSEFITTQEVNTMFGITETLVYTLRRPSTKTKLPTTSKDPREVHVLLNYKTIAYDKFWDDGSFSFPSAYFTGCRCSQRVGYNKPIKE